MKAHNEVSKAVKEGRLVRPSQCEDCGRQGRTVAHHEDYAKPLAVEWLCRSCHRRSHANRGRIMVGRGPNDPIWLTARIPAALYEQLEQRAEKNDRSLSGELRLAIRHHLEPEKERTTA